MRVAACVAAFAIGCGSSAITNVDEQADTVCGKGQTVKGIDVSFYQGDIDWSKVAADGVQFAFVRVSDGTTNPDDQFDTYWLGSRQAGIAHGAYQFFRASEDPIAQADMVIDAAAPMAPDDLPPVLDVEVADGQSAATVAAGVRAWTEHVEAAFGRAPIIYTGKYFWDDSVAATDLGDLPLWHAQYTSAACPDISGTWSDWAFWQYTSTGTIDGIDGGVDVDRWNGDLPSLRAWLGGPARQACAPIPAEGGVIDDGDPCFAEGGPLSYMREVSGGGDEGDLVWTHATDAASEANFADWTIAVAQPGRYRVDVYTASPWAMSKRADYHVHSAGGAEASVTLDQTAANGWQSLGEFSFDGGSGQGVHLGDNTGEPSSGNVQLVFDALQLTPIAPQSLPGGSDTQEAQPPSGSELTTGGCSGGAGIGGLLGLATLFRRRRRR